MKTKQQVLGNERTHIIELDRATRFDASQPMSLFPDEGENIWMTDPLAVECLEASVVDFPLIRKSGSVVGYPTCENLSEFCKWSEDFRRTVEVASFFFSVFH